MPCHYLRSATVLYVSPAIKMNVKPPCTQEEGVVDVVSIDLSAVGGYAVADLLPLVSAARRMKISALFDTGKAAQSLWAELLPRGLACSLLGIANKEVTFTAGSHGKPFLAGYPDFHFNVSHSASHVLCGVGAKPVGVDIERIRPLDPDMARLWFSAAEYACFRNTPPEERPELFYAIWTLKESYSKAVGLGIGLDPKSFTILPEGANSAVLVTKAPYPTRFFRTYRLEDGYRAAVCSCDNHFPDQVRQIDGDTLLEWLRGHSNQ